MRYLVDSDVLINAASGRSEAQQVLHETSADGAAISIISVGELYEGAVNEPDPTRGQKLARLRAFLYAFPVLNLSDSIMERFARLRAELRGQGRLIPDLDLLIAATAIDHDLTLVTRNVSHFQRIPALDLHPKK